MVLGKGAFLGWIFRFTFLSGSRASTACQRLRWLFVVQAMQPFDRFGNTREASTKQHYNKISLKIAKFGGCGWPLRGRR
jgi:hypothetical protein